MTPNYNSPSSTAHDLDSASAMTSDIESWALPRLAKLLPLDDESLKQVIAYTCSLPKDGSADHLKNFLDDSPAALEFISSFNSRRGGKQTTSPASQGQNRVTDADGDGSRNPTTDKRGSKKLLKGRLHTPPTARHPDGYGDTRGGYVKSEKEEEYMTGTGYTGKATSKGQSSREGLSSKNSSRNQSPAPAGKNKQPPSASGHLISEYLPNVRTKRVSAKTSGPSSQAQNSAQTSSAKGSRNSGNNSASTSISTTTNNISDLTAAIAALEVATNPKERQQRKCNCDASIHPLFNPAPNCLSCGKIICALEGLQPCSFCGAALLSNNQIQDMIRELRSERGNEKMRAHNENLRRHDSNVPSPTRGTTSTLDAATAHRDKLLSFQAHNAQRTKITDEAADFDFPNTSSTQWMSPAQRALALKKQQKFLREMEDQARPEWEKKSVVMSLDIKRGKVIRTFDRTDQSPVNAPETVVDAEPDEPLETTNRDTGENGTFSHNPLLTGSGLVRPIWKPAVGQKDGVSTQKREQKQTWRRVQDDNDDDERWILDGGLHGFTQETDT
ncbi:hypothetical protein FQN57_002940 [Myotisia sp. PD_48]|nr:hypothetical protein FQN57_002940 [Myotisia sp. PD_48]